MNAGFLNKILIAVSIVLAVLLGLSMGGVLPYVSHVSISPVFFTITSTSYVTYTSTAYSTITRTSTTTTMAIIMRNYTETLTTTSVATQVSSTTVTVTVTNTVTITPSTTTTLTTSTTTSPSTASPLLLLNTTANTGEYTGFIMNNSLYIYYTAPLSQLIGVRIIGLNITNAPVPVSSGVGAPDYYNNGLLFIENIGGSFAIVYWDFKTMRVLTPVVGYYVAYAFNPGTSLEGALWMPRLLAFNETRLLILKDWSSIVANVSMPYANTIQECPNGSFIIQLLNSTIVVYPGFRDYNGYQAFGCDYYMIANTLYYDGKAYYLGARMVFTAYPNGSLIIVLTPGGVSVYDLSMRLLFSVPVNTPASAEVFRLGEYYYVIASSLGRLVVYAVKA
ncbi:hypothetical protein [Caldivirga sp.]|uniref:hypothetical protein n=1 Tax=Caldivirga sp. TaxID=2080243 RepID=UPI003D13FC27